MTSSFVNPETRKVQRNHPLGMRKLSNSDCDEMKDYDFARITAINEDYYGRSFYADSSC